MARAVILLMAGVVALAALATAFPQVNVNYPGGFVNVPQNGQPGPIQVAYPGGFVNVPNRLATLLSGEGPPPVG